MANWVYSATNISSGGDGSLNSIDGNILTDGDSAIVFDFVEMRVLMYTLDETSGLPESLPEVVIPIVNAGSKRWILLNSGVNKFIELTDVPSSFSNGKYLRSTADSLEWVDAPEGGGTSTDLMLDSDTTSAVGIKIIHKIGENVSFGDVLSYDFSSSSYVKSNASSTSTRIPARVMSLEDSTANSQCTLLISGTVKNSLWNWSNGDLYMSLTDGLMTQTPPSDSEEYIQILGYPLTNTTIIFNPDPTIIRLSTM